MNRYMDVQSQSPVQFFATPETVTHHSSVHGIFQARVLEWGAICLLRIDDILLLSSLFHFFYLHEYELDDKTLRKAHLEQHEIF